MNGARDSVMEWRSKGSLVLSQLEEDTREALKEGLKETVPDIITSHGYKVSTELSKQIHGAHNFNTQSRYLTAGA